MARLEGAGEEILGIAAKAGHISTGSPTLDALLGGGIRAGRLTEIYGRSNSGKTQLAMQAALVAASMGIRSLYIDTEGGFRPERLEEVATARRWAADGLLNNIVYTRSDSSWAQMNAIREMETRDATRSSRLVIIDTLTRNFSIDMPGTANLQGRQAALDVHLSEMARDAVINSRAYLLTNRVTFGDGHDVSIGGRTVEDLVSCSIRLDREKAKIRATRIGDAKSVTVGLGKDGIT